MKKLLIPLFVIIIFISYPFIELYANRSMTESYPSPHDYLPEPEPDKKKPVRLPPATGSDKSNNASQPTEKKSKTHYELIEVLVNKDRALPAGYEPPDLTVPDIPFSFEEDLPKKKMRKEAAKAVEMLFAQAKREGLYLVGVSAYRSYRRQADIFNYNSKVKGEAEANRVSARPGESEHQTGLAIDVSTPAVGCQLSEEFGDTKEGQWLKANAHKYGFIIRYPQNKERITGYQFEPWHLRYVGKKAAGVIAKNGLTLEEYFSS